MQLSLLDQLDADELERFKALFEPKEWARIQDRVHYVIRDRQIRANFKVMKANGATYDRAIRSLAAQYHLSESQVSHIVYPRTRKGKERRR